jgi:aquaporin Z
VLVAVGGNIVYLMNCGAISPTAIVVAPGLMVMVIILFMGNVSGAHLNPVVSIAFARAQWKSRGVSFAVFPEEDE